MQSFFVILVATFIAIAMLMAGLGVKVLLRKRGEFKRHCASRDPYSGKANGCVCDQHRQAACTSDKERYQPLDVNQNLMNEIKP